jgi:hypothetical protein
MDDPSTADDFAPTLADVRDPDPVTGIDPNDAFAPFSEEFDSNDGKDAGESCEPFYMDIYDTEESYARFVSPSSYYPGEMCNEVNVVVFNDLYEGRGLDSAFALTVPEQALPIDKATGNTAVIGWASLNFSGTGTATGLTASASGVDFITREDWGIQAPQIPHPGAAAPILDVHYTGLPVDGFMLSIYDTDPGQGAGGAVRNHTMINEHKYETSVSDRCDAPQCD